MGRIRAIELVERFPVSIINTKSWVCKAFDVPALPQKGNVGPWALAGGLRRKVSIN